MPFDALPEDAPGAFGFAAKSARAAKRASLEWATRPAGWRVEDARRRRGATSHQAGLAAEDAVARRYASLGAGILARRWRCPHGEIDIIARDGDGLVFIEVKRRSQPIEDDPVGERQWRRLEMAAETYMFTAETGETPVRFDLAVVGVDGAIQVITNARC